MVEALRHREVDVGPRGDTPEYGDGGFIHQPRYDPVDDGLQIDGRVWASRRDTVAIAGFGRRPVPGSEGSRARSTRNRMQSQVYGTQ
jgi:hypothetical protein